MAKFYTDFFLRGKTLYVREIDHGIRSKYKTDVHPVLYLPSEKSNTGYKSLNGQSLEPRKFETPKAAREYARNYEDVPGYNVFAYPNFGYTAINELYGNDRGVGFDFSKINIVYIDIEVEKKPNGRWASVHEADAPINAITVSCRGRRFCFGVQAIDGVLDYDAKYIECKNERDLLEKFLKLWKALDPDIISGWNIDFFDIPYIVRRLRLVLGMDSPKNLSPWGFVTEKTAIQYHQEHIIFNIAGVPSLDYLQLYKKFTYSKEETYKLDYIGHIELGERKLDTSEYADLADLYKKDYKKFLNYNVRDVELLEQLDRKKNFMLLACTIAYAGKTTLADVFTSVRLWDIIISNYLFNRDKTIVPYEVLKHASREFAGGFVKDPLRGMYDWVGSLDLTSLYPSLIITYNISPETMLSPTEFYTDLDADKVVAAGPEMEEISKRLKEDNLSLCANGSLYKRDVKGFLPELMTLYFNRRAEAKKAMKVQKNLKEDILRELERRKALS